MGIMINEGGTLKKIGDNLHPGSVFLLDLMANTLSELGFTSSHYVSGAGYIYMKYVNSFDIGFEPTFALIIPLVGGTYGGVAADAFINNSYNYIHNFGPNYGGTDVGMFGNHTSELCLQGNSIPKTNTDYYITFHVSRNSKTPHTFVSNESANVEARLAFELQGSKLDLYGYIMETSSVTWDGFKDTYFYYRVGSGTSLSPIFLVIAI